MAKKKLQDKHHDDEPNTGAEKPDLTLSGDEFSGEADTATNEGGRERDGSDRRSDEPTDSDNVRDQTLTGDNPGHDPRNQGPRGSLRDAGHNKPENAEDEDDEEKDTIRSADLTNERGPDQGIEPNPAQEEGVPLEQSLRKNKEHQEALRQHSKHGTPHPARDPITGDVVGITPGDTVPKDDKRVIRDKDKVPEPKVADVKGFLRVGNRLINLASVAALTLPAKNDKSNTITIMLNNGAKEHTSGEQSHEILKAFGACCEDELNLVNESAVQKMREDRTAEEKKKGKNKLI